jgi:hypothetical protein
MTGVYSFAGAATTNDGGRASCMDESGNSYFSGNFSASVGGTLDFDPTAGVANLSYSGSGPTLSNGFITK